MIDLNNRIYLIRGMRVMMDADLAELYGIETKSLKQAVKRNLTRFPEDFMFQLTKEEYLLIKTNPDRNYLPFMFTENGVAMLSSVLNSEQAIQINIQIMRLFTKLKNFSLLEENLNLRIDKFEDRTSRAFRLVFEEIELLKENPKLNPHRKKIGFN
jgi:hypothetical protein